MTCVPSRARRAVQDAARQRFAVVGAHQVPKRAGSVELAIGDQRSRSVRRQARAQMLQVVEAASSSHGRNRASSRTSAPVPAIRRQTTARPSASAHTETMPGVGSPNPRPFVLALRAIAASGSNVAQTSVEIAICRCFGGAAS